MEWQEQIPEEFAAEQNSSGSASPPKMRSQLAARSAGSETLSSSPSATPAIASSPAKVNDSSGNGEDEDGDTKMLFENWVDVSPNVMADTRKQIVVAIAKQLPEGPPGLAQPSPVPE